MTSFVALDFETANNARSSICAIGLVFVENLEIVDERYTLVQPEEDFSYWNTQVHGITARDVAGSPTFPEIYPRLCTHLEGRTMIAHNLSFDAYALKDCLAKYTLTQPNIKMLCSLQLTKKLMKGLSSYKLNHLSEQFGIPLQQHHNAIQDARACAEIMIHLHRVTGAASLEQLAQEAKMSYGVMRADGTFVSSKSKR
ncbi:MAG: 3'-5' exonuclease [Bacilli bacterium]